MNILLKSGILLLTLGTAGAFPFADGQTPPDTKPWSVRMAESEMRRHPVPCLLDSPKGLPEWNYTTGLEIHAFMDVYNRYGDPAMWDYVLRYADTMITDEGDIRRYVLEKYNLDHIKPGTLLFQVYEHTGETKYRKAMDLLRRQLLLQPRTHDGGFWHKLIYPRQMWLDGLYMGSPFYAMYIARFETGKARTRDFEDVARQFLLMAEHSYDPVTKLYRHVWDETRTQFWADKTTGLARHSWGRAVGWYLIGIVDALDYIPEGTKGRREMIEIFRNLYRELPRYADRQTGMWYQVLELPDRAGNYQEATCSAMITYAMLKGIRMGYLDASLLPQAKKNYENLVKTFIRENPDGTISLTRCCEVAGVGGVGTNATRSGTFDYYINEKIRDNDPKGVGPFIWASLEYEALQDKK